MAYKGKHVRKSKTGQKLIIALICFALIVGAGILTTIIVRTHNEPSPTTPQLEELPEQLQTEATTETVQTEPTEPPEPSTEPTKPAPVIKTATIGNMGDLLMHLTLFGSQYSAEAYLPDGTYNFESIFKYIKEDISEFDYAVINLETTLCGTGNGYKYSGYPSFNCPDNIVQSAAEAGFDMLLTANNHSYDTSLKGYKRTLEVSQEAGLNTIGTYSSADEEKWEIIDVNGIDVGMLCYTYASYDTDDNRPSLNGNAPIAEAGLCNYFCYENLDEFYTEAEEYLNAMEEAGADILIFYIHWGEEYQLTENSWQKTIAQKLCDMGVDVIVGGHPHVVQPVDLLTSTEDEAHKTFCIYSTGNAVSNQRKGNISYVNTAHTEDGIIFSVTITQIDDEEAYVSDVKATPTWVNMHTNEKGRREYNILPLHITSKSLWQETFGLTDKTYQQAQDSYERTMKIIGNGFTKINEYLSQYASVG